MKFEAYWEKLVAANPALAQNGHMTIPIDRFKKQVAKAFAAGRREPADTKKAARDFAKVGSRSDAADIFKGFGGMFG